METFLYVLAGLAGLVFFAGIVTVFFFVVRGFLKMDKRREDFHRTWDRYNK